MNVEDVVSSHIVVVPQMAVIHPFVKQSAINVLWVAVPMNAMAGMVTSLVVPVIALLFVDM